MKRKYVFIVLVVFLGSFTYCKKDRTEDPKPASLQVDTTTIAFGTIEKIGELKTQRIILSNSGGGNVSWNATANKDWLQLNHVSGVIYDKKDTLIITVNSAMLSFGDNQAEITITPKVNDVNGVPKKIKITANINTQTINGYKLTKDETWSGNILLKGDIAIPSGYTLTINAGTKIFVAARNLVFDEGFTKYAVDFYINGKLIIKGTAQNVVQIMSAETIPTNVDWWGIGMTTGSQLEMNYCAISNSSYGVFVFSNMASAPIIKNCLFSNISMSIVDFGSFESTFSNNSFQNVDYGYSGWGTNRNVQLNYCEFNTIRYTDADIAGVQNNTSSNMSITINNSNFANNKWYNLHYDEYGSVKDSKITANSCYGIQTYPSNLNGNTIVLQNQLSAPNQNAGCGFALPVKSCQVKSSTMVDKNAVQLDFEKALELNRKNILKSH